MNKNISFSTRQKEILISEVQLRPVLWDDRNKNYKNTEMTKKIWNQVGAACGVTGKLI